MSKKLVMIDCLSQHLVKYVIEVDEDVDVDTFYLENKDIIEEYSQKHICEEILQHRVISKKEYLKLFDIDNAYLKSWNEEQKLEFINRFGVENESDTGNEA